MAFSRHDDDFDRNAVETRLANMLDYSEAQSRNRAINNLCSLLFSLTNFNSSSLSLLIRNFFLSTMSKFHLKSNPTIPGLDFKNVNYLSKKITAINKIPQWFTLTYFQLVIVFATWSYFFTPSGCSGATSESPLMYLSTSRYSVVFIYS